MKRRRLRAGDVEWALIVIGVVGLMVALATPLVATTAWRAGGGSWCWVIGVFVVVLWALQAWRWQIVLDEDAMTIAPALSRLPRVVVGPVRCHPRRPAGAGRRAR